MRQRSPPSRPAAFASVILLIHGACAQPSVQLGVRNAHAMVFDEAAGRLLLFGGADEAHVVGDTWTWRPGEPRWERVATAGPAPRTFPAMAYDAARGEAVLFGGNRVLFGTGKEGDTILGDTWVSRGGRWTEYRGAGPRARAEASMTFDRRRQRIVLFGGRCLEGGESVRLGDTWEWDGRSWR